VNNSIGAAIVRSLMLGDSLSMPSGVNTGGAGSLVGPPDWHF
jgi:hypothetical protein